MYNEDEVLFCRTLHGVMKNIAHLCSRNKSRTWGPDGWKKVVVAIIADGRKKVHPRVLDCLAALGVYQEGVAKNLVNGKVVEAHVYEWVLRKYARGTWIENTEQKDWPWTLPFFRYTTQLSIDSNLTFKGAERGLVPMQIIFCLKEHVSWSLIFVRRLPNSPQISFLRSYRTRRRSIRTGGSLWVFKPVEAIHELKADPTLSFFLLQNAFSPILQPNVCVLLDVGTRPENKSIYYLWKAFDLNSNCAGCCGEIVADTGGKWGVGPALLNPLVAAQNFEYKVSFRPFILFPIFHIWQLFDLIVFSRSQTFLTRRRNRSWVTSVFW